MKHTSATKLSKAELKAQQLYLHNLKAKKRTTKKQFIIALVGLIGSGKSYVAKKLSSKLKANIINGDQIRIYLRKQNNWQYQHTHLISQNILKCLIDRGENIIFYSDFATGPKQKNLIAFAKKNKLALYFIRTYCNFDSAAGRIINTHYQNKITDFFGGAKSDWPGKNKGAVVKLREMYRRTPHHYNWENKIGGQWILKKLPLKFLAEIDTSKSKKINPTINKIIKKLANN